MSMELVFLFKKRHFLPLFLTQFFGAFNDNAFKLAMLTLISYRLTHSQEQSEYYQALAGALFIIPFFLFSATAGQLADKYDKALIAKLVKVLELVLMLIGAIALYKSSIFFMMVVLTGMGIHSSFFGPIKYAILPDLLPQEVLLGANGLIEGSTFIAILLGTTLGTLTVGTINNPPYATIIITIGAAFAGLIASLFIPQAPSSAPDLKVEYHLGLATMKVLKEVNAKPEIFYVLVTISWFWLIGAVMLTKMPDYTHYVLGANSTVFALFLALFSIGIAMGSIMINRLLRGRNRLFIVPIAMLAFSIFTFDLYQSSFVTTHETLLTLFVFFSSLNHWRIAVDLFFLALSAGLFVVPLYTYLQVASSPELRARTIAANNIYNALFMVLGTLFVMIFLRFNLSIPHVFLIVSFLNGIVAIFFIRVLKKLKSNQ